MNSRALLTLGVVVLALVLAGPAEATRQWPGDVHCASGAGTFVRGVNCRLLGARRGFTTPRRYVAWVPRSALDRMARGVRVPLVVMLHGSTGTGEQFLKHSGWKQKAT